MSISRDEAAKALSDIASTQGRSQDLRGYQIAGPILVVWGAIWVLAYCATGIAQPDLWGWVWLPADVVGIVATVLMMSRHKKRIWSRATALRMFGFLALIVLFCCAVFSMIHPRDSNVYLAFPGLLTGTIYATIGLWRMTRYIWVGGIVFAATLIGYFVFPSWLPYWMAATGGGGLIIGGLLLWRS